RTTYSGAALRFGEAQQVPEGTQILWDFGDGTPQQQGPSVVHSFSRAGVYTVVETIRDKDGQTRSSRTHVTALQRTVPMAVPADVRAALLVATPWARMAVHRGVAAKLSMGSLRDDLARSVSEGAGFDVLPRRVAGATERASGAAGVGSIVPGKGLAAEPGFAASARHVGLGDAVFFSRSSDRGAAAAGQFSSELGVSAFAVYDKPESRDLLQV